MPLSAGNVEQWCADCASEVEHCQKAGLKKAQALSEPGSSNSTILSQLTLSGLPLFQQDIMCVYHSAHLCF